MLGKPCGLSSQDWVQTLSPFVSWVSLNLTCESQGPSLPEEGRSSHVQQVSMTLSSGTESTSCCLREMLHKCAYSPESWNDSDQFLQDSFGASVRHTDVNNPYTEFWCFVVCLRVGHRGSWRLASPSRRVFSTSPVLSCLFICLYVSNRSDPKQSEKESIWCTDIKVWWKDS